MYTTSMKVWNGCAMYNFVLGLLTFQCVLDIPHIPQNMILTVDVIKRIYWKVVSIDSDLLSVYNILTWRS